MTDKDKPKKPFFLARYWRETVGELRKVVWPTPQEAWRLTKIVLIVVVSMSAVLGAMDWVFSKLVTLLYM